MLYSTENLIELKLEYILTHSQLYVIIFYTSLGLLVLIEIMHLHDL